MPKKKATNTSKTAHVMNLISKNYDAAPSVPDEPSKNIEANNEQQASPPAAKAVSPAPATILPSLHSDVEITSQIKSALEDLIEEPPSSVPPAETKNPEEEASGGEAETENAEKEVSETSAEEKLPEASEITETPVPPAETEQLPESETIPAPLPEEPVIIETSEPVSLQETPIPEAEPAEVESETVEPAPTSSTETEPAEEAKPEEAPLPPVSSEAIHETASPSPSSSSYINVMQELVEESADRYIKMFGLCDCPKCVADVKAIALNNLVPKYIVAPENEKNPRVIIYNERYHAEVTAQILRACKIVMEHPLHDQ